MPSTPRKSTKPAKTWKTAAELEAMLAAASGLPVRRISVYGSGERWEATVIGSTGTRAAVKIAAMDLRREYGLKD